MNRAQCVVVRGCSWLGSHTGALIAGLAVVWMVAAPRPMWGQWSGTNPVWTNSNVGVGTTSPAYTLHISGSNGSKFFGFDPTGSGTGGAPGLYETLWFGGPNGYGPSLYMNQDGPSYANARLEFTTLGGQANRVDTMALVNGNVGIGTTSPQHLLHVAGTIGAQEIIVSSTGADYVFSPTYRLRPLHEVAAYIDANHHLPDVPSAAEMKESGMKVGEIQSKLLAKIEELTLHMIGAEERNARLEQQNRQLQDRLTRLENAVAAKDPGPGER